MKRVRYCDKCGLMKLRYERQCPKCGSKGWTEEKPAESAAMNHKSYIKDMC